MADIISHSHCQYIAQVKTNALGKRQCRHTCTDDEMAGGRRAAGRHIMCCFRNLTPSSTDACSIINIDQNLPFCWHFVPLGRLSLLCGNRPKPPTAGGPCEDIPDQITLQCIGQHFLMKNLRSCVLYVVPALTRFTFLASTTLSATPRRMRRAATRAAALLPLRRSTETMVPLLFGRFMARAIGGDGYRNPGYPLKNGKSPWVSVFVDEGTDGTHTFGLLIPLPCPAQPCSYLSPPRWC